MSVEIIEKTMKRLPAETTHPHLLLKFIDVTLLSLLLTLNIFQQIVLVFLLLTLNKQMRARLKP